MTCRLPPAWQNDLELLCTWNTISFRKWTKGGYHSWECRWNYVKPQMIRQNQSHSQALFLLIAGKRLSLGSVNHSELGLHRAAQNLARQSLAWLPNSNDFTVFLIPPDTVLFAESAFTILQNEGKNSIINLNEHLDEYSHPQTVPYF